MCFHGNHAKINDCKCWRLDALWLHEQTWEVSALMNEKQWRKLVSTVIGVKYMYIRYANQVWALYKKKHVELLEHIQRRATLLIQGLSEYSYKNMLWFLKLPTLLYRCLRGDMIEVLKILNHKYDIEPEVILPRCDVIVLVILQEGIIKCYLRKGHI